MNQINFKNFGDGATSIVAAMGSEEITRFDQLFKEFDAELRLHGYTDLQIAAGHFMQMREYDPARRVENPDPS
jgi:hypothetical protein